MLHIVFYLSIYLASWRDNDGFVHKRIKYGTILPETSSFRTGEVNFNSSFGSTDHWFVHDILKTCILQYPRDINNHWEPSNGRIQEMLHTSGHPSIWLKCPRGASNVSVCSIFRPVLCLHYVRYAGTSQYQYDVLRLWKTSLEDGWMDGETSFASWVRKPWGLWTWSVHQLLGSAIRYHQNIPCAVFSCYATLHPLYILMSYVSELFDGILLSWFFVHSGSYPTKPLYRKMAYLWLTTQVSCSQGIFFKFLHVSCELTSSAWSKPCRSGSGGSSDRNSVIKKKIYHDDHNHNSQNTNQNHH